MYRMSIYTSPGDWLPTGHSQARTQRQKMLHRQETENTGTTQVIKKSSPTTVRHWHTSTDHKMNRIGRRPFASPSAECGEHDSDDDGNATKVR